MLKEVLIGAAGIGVGYLIARNQLEKKYAHLLDVEVQRTREFFGEYEGPEDPEFMEQAIKTADAMTEYTGGEKKINPAKLAEAVTASVKRDADQAPIPYNRMGDPTLNEELDDIRTHEDAVPLDRDARAPYVITFEEFDSNETGAEQITVSFFAGDGIVIDESDEVISPDRVEQIIGMDNLNKFGTNTEDPNMDPNVLYVRCERFNMDFEVTRSAGKHSVEVLGQTG